MDVAERKPGLERGAPAKKSSNRSAVPVAADLDANTDALADPKRLAAASRDADARKHSAAALTPKSSLDASSFSLLKKWQSDAAPAAASRHAMPQPAPAEVDEEGYGDEGFEEYSDEFEGTILLHHVMLCAEQQAYTRSMQER
jgi:hypothetical protein